MNDDGFWLGVVLASIIWIAIAFWIKGEVDNSWRQQIEQHGCAGYYLDTNRDRQWNWKP